MTAAGRYDTLQRLLSRLDRRTRDRLLEHLATMPPARGRAASPMRAMLLQLCNRRRAHSRRLWARWLEPVTLRDPALLAIATPLPGCIHLADTAGWWAALSRRMGGTPADIQHGVERRLAHASLDGVLTSDEATGWSEALRERSLEVIRSLRKDAGARMAFLEDANAERALAAEALSPSGDAPQRTLGDLDLDTLTTALSVAPAWQRLGGRAATMEVDDLLASVRSALTSGGISPDAMALYAVAGLYARRDPLLGAALRALLPLPLVEAAVAGLSAGAEDFRLPLSELEPMSGTQVRGLDGGLRALFDAAMASGHPLSPADAKRLGRALAGVVDVHAPTGP
ncbi:hypothetical protein [Azospirillum sp. sgz302134]